MDRRTPVSICFLLVTLLLLAAAPPAHPWGAFRGIAGIKRTDTHQQIMLAAYGLLMNDPRFSGMAGIPTAGGRLIPFESIVQFEGVDGSLRTLAPYGPGPDAEGSTLYSCHWFNPQSGRGQAPQSAADWYLRFLQAILGVSGGDEEVLKGLAWSAHFLSDMFVPYHIVGIPADEALARKNAGNYILSEAEAGPSFLTNPGFQAPRIEQGSILAQGEQALGEWWREGWGVNSNFRESMGIFEANFSAAGAGKQLNHLDWYDPWYWNGTPAKTAVVGILFSDAATDPGRAVFSSHASYESWAHGRFLETGGYKNYGIRPYPYDLLWKNPAPDYAFSGTALQAQAWQVQDFAAKIALRTRQKLANYHAYPEQAVRDAIEGVYTLWRSAYTALRLAITIDRDPENEGLFIRTDVFNHAQEACHDAHVRLSIRRGDGIVASEIQPLERPVMGTLTGSELRWFFKVNPNEPWTVVAEVVGVFDTTPDLQYGIASVQYTPDRSQQQARPVEEADAGDFVGSFVHTDPQRSYEQYHGEMILHADGTFAGVETLANGTDVRRGSGTWKFNPMSMTVSVDWEPGGEFSGSVSGNTADFTINGRWSNGGAGTLRFQRR